MKNYLTSALCFALSGCIATTDLLHNETNLNSSQKSILKEMAEKTQNICILYTYDTISGDKLSGDRKINKLPVAKRFYTSDSGWFKVYFMTNGVWDYSFYNPKDYKFVCGEKQWGKLKESRKIIFDEVEVELKKDSSPVLSIKSNNQIIEDKLKNLRNLRQRNLITEKQYDDLVKKIFE